MAQVNLSYLSDIWSWEKKGQETIEETAKQKGTEVSRKEKRHDTKVKQSGETWPEKSPDSV